MEKILILGGTQFVGKNLVEQLIAMDNYDISIFNRQKTQGGLFPELNKIKGDRNTNDIKKIANEHWDYIIDLSCYYPDWIANTIHYTNNIKKYIFISTISVYDIDNNDYSLKNEEYKTYSCTSKQRTDTSLKSYGHRKAECERILKKSGLNYTILRPALVYGKYDHTDRLYYWLYQVKKSKNLLIPDNGKSQLSLTYVCDLVNAIINELLTDTNNNETYNIISSPKTNIKEIIDITKDILNTKNTIINATPNFLEKNNISQWFDMPLWLNEKCYNYSNKKYMESTNIKLTALGTGIIETIKYYSDLKWKKPKYGMSESKRIELVKKII